VPDYFVLDPNNDCIRPYRILIKKNWIILVDKDISKKN
jgi:hypothetical protein